MKQNILKALFTFSIIALVALGSELRSAEWYRGQLHCHSHWSDGNTLPELAIGWYKDEGFHFMSLTDHNVLQLDSNKWKEVPVALVNASKAKFGSDWVETKEEEGKMLVRLKTIAEISQKLNDPGKFLLIPGHEQNTHVAGFSLHANAINITQSIPFPNDFPSVAVAATAWRKASLANSAESNLEGFWMLNHPDWPYYDNPPEVFIEANEIEFYENNMSAGPRKRQPQMPDQEKYWDIINRPVL